MRRLFSRFLRPVSALCLGGGGARGFGHIGAIKAFEEAGIDFDVVVGTSVGSYVGCLYAAGIKSSQMIDFAHDLNLKDIHSGSLLFPSPAERIGASIQPLIGDKKIEELSKKFAAVAVDLVTARQVIIDKGRVTEAVSASCAVPLFFKPLNMGNLHLVDGGLLNNIPADVCRMLGAEFVVAVDINPTRGGGTPELKTLDILKATFNIMSATSSSGGYINSDVIITPNMSDFSAFKKDGYERMIQLGYEEAHAQIAKIRAVLKPGKKRK